MKLTSLLLALLMIFAACTPMSDEPAPEDQKKDAHQSESYGTDRPN